MSYVGVGDLPALTEAERKMAHDDPELFAFELQKRELALRAKEVEAAKSSAFWEGLQAFMMVAIPVAAYLGLEKFLGLSKLEGKI